MLLPANAPPLPMTVQAPLPVPSPSPGGIADGSGAPPPQSMAAATPADVAILSEPPRRDEAVDLRDLPVVRAAMLGAIRAGVAQNFVLDDLSGSVVAGPPALVEGKVCRTIVLLTKGRGALHGQASDERLCLASSGAWVRGLDADPASVPGAIGTTEATTAPFDPLAD